MRVRDLPLPAAVRDHLADRGIEELYPPQAAAVEAGLLDGEAVVAAVPTAGGKTLIAQLATLAADGPGLYIVPLRALAREKYETFSALPGVDVAISTGDLDAPAEDLAGHDVVVATAEKVDSAIRNGATWVDDLACVVVDEVHLLGTEERGPTLEVTLATLRRRTPDAQVVALSATVENADEVAGWLDATLVESSWRPVDLRTGVYAGGRVAFDDGATRTVAVPTAADPDTNARTEATAALVADAVGDGGGALAFVRSRREAESLCDRLRAEEFPGAPEVAEEVRQAGATRTGRALATGLRDGVAFHHAGLRSAHRRIVESAFRNREIAAICATPTLAAGVNVPARRVVVRDQRRFTGEGMEWLPVLEVHQMCGRAGRPGLDPYGEAVLVADAGEREELEERYVGATPERVESRLADPTALRTHVLSVVASGVAGSRADLVEVFGASFHAHQAGDADLDASVNGALDDLTAMGMLDRDGLAATDLGATVSRQYVTPETGRRLVDGLQTAAGMDGAATALTALEVVCHTPDMRTGHLGNRERADVYRFAADHADEFTTAMGEAEAFEAWLAAVETARVLAGYADGVDAERLVERHRIGPGDLESRVERAEWLLGAAAALGEVVGVDVPAVRETRDRLARAGGPGEERAA
ncbi:MAG: DEAD/DEAH box helicase [Haloferacaceae archaeon]